jgi:ATP-dependent RNA helicase DeaD
MNTQGVIHQGTDMTDTNISSFSSFGLSEAVLEALAEKGFAAPSSIQTIAIPRMLHEDGHLIVKARTGTGKTAAFGIPLVERITRQQELPQALILTPTRELALQVSREIRSFCKTDFPRITAVYGGAPIRSQIKDLARGVEIVVGTPGRVMDLIDRRVLNLSAIDWFILDEGDEMLDMGFLEDVETILAATKPNRRVALFSATMPDQILKIVHNHIGKVDILEDKTAVDEKPAVDQFYMVVKREDKLEAFRRIVDSADDFYGLVFCATKVGTDEIARRLVEAGYAAEAIHGDLSQEARERTLRRFRARHTTILVATDVAARGIDIERLSHVINWDLPNDRETYVHRIGRTGRAGRQGTAISFVLPMEQGRISHLSRNIQRTLGVVINWMRAPSVKSVMQAARKRIIDSVLNTLPQIDDSDEAEHIELEPTAHGVVAKELIEKLGPEKAVEALVALTYGDIFDPTRYGPITEFSEQKFDRPEAFNRPGRGRRGEGRFGEGRRGDDREGRDGRKGGSFGRNRSNEVPKQGQTRVFVGVGRKQGASAKDIAGILMRAGGVPGRLVDAIEVKDFCAYAIMPEEAAKRAYSFSKRAPENPPIKPAPSKNS